MSSKELSASNPSPNTREDDDQKAEVIRRRAGYLRAIAEASRASAEARLEKAEQDRTAAKGSCQTAEADRRAAEEHRCSVKKLRQAAK